MALRGERSSLKDREFWSSPQRHDESPETKEQIEPEATEEREERGRQEDHETQREDGSGR